MKKTRPISVLLAFSFLLSSSGLLGCRIEPGATPSPSSVDVVSAGEAIVEATGKVVPVRWADLGFSTNGSVKEVFVNEGERVTANQVLATLDAPGLESAVEQAETAVRIAEAQLAKLEAGASVEQVRSAEIGVSLAQDRVAAAKMAAKVAQSSIRIAETALGAAQATLKQVQTGPTADELEVARQNVELAKAQLYSVQGQRDAAGGRRGKPGYQDGSYEAAEGQVMAGETSVTIAELSRRILAVGARDVDVAVVQAQVEQARAALEVARVQAQAAQQQVSVANRQVRQAQAQLDIVRAPARQEDLALARAQVAQAKATVDGAKAMLEKTLLRAPFAGTIGEMNLRQGEYMIMGVPVIALGQLSSFRVETTDLDEIDIARVAEGSEVTLMFDALPDMQMRGTVEQIALKAGAGSGGTVYKTIITFEQTDPRLRWGMTAFADIETE